ncbi:MAG: endolytic transglycosylase MltG [Ornithinimicrobium sp.]|uniref:endolytic transglycosylase MltG n=1 Tax=Ornithinimicrobium sp. TaxID=1977084 RepID=UPI003D9B3AE6
MSRISDDERYDGAHYDDAYDDHLHDDPYDDGHGPGGGLLPGEPEQVHHRPSPGRRRPPHVRWGALLGALVVVVVGGYLAVQVLAGLVPSFSFGSDAPEDYEGSGSGEVSVEIPDGAGGAEIGRVLAEADVVASAEAFTSLAIADDRSATIQPGTYRMAEQMSAASALERLLEPDSRVVTGVTIREGLWKEEVFALLAEGTDNAAADYESVDPATLGLPEAAGGDVEGYLFPDTYSFGPDSTPQQHLQKMVDLGKQRYAELGLEGEELERTLIDASLIQAEAAFSDDLPKVARVIENRLEEEMPLGFDSTIHFMFKERGRAGTTDEQRATESPYNTYLNTGLPPGPINSPGVAAIEAAMDPADGPWTYFVTVNPSTGETKFATTFEEHEQNVAEFQQWCRDNPDGC